MTLLVAGLLIFLGVHSVRIVAEDWRTQTRERIGENAFKGAYSVLSLLGFALIIWGYGAARMEPIALWGAPVWTRHLAALINVLAIELLVAAYVPGNGIKARLHHPMVLGVKTWALAHLIANNTVADLLLFGSFLVWAVFSYRAARQRDAAAKVVYPAGNMGATVATVVIGIAVWAGLAFWAHGPWFGVKPFG